MGEIANEQEQLALSAENLHDQARGLRAENLHDQARGLCAENLHDQARGLRAENLNVAEVVVPRPLPGPLSYLIPEDLSEQIRLGSLVQVPFRSGVSHGYVVGFTSIADPRLVGVRLKQVLAAPFPDLVFSGKDLEFFQWISDYYQLPIGEVFHSAFPKVVFQTPKSSRRSTADKPSRTIQANVSELLLTIDQSQAMNRIASALSARAYKSFLLFGVTGSGKTELYIRSARQALDQGRTALILVPEIALTPQLRCRFEERFGDHVAVLHSGLTEKQRRHHWWRILKGECKVVVGARSALFAPLKDLGLVVVDEEHEPSYKQEDHLRYNARDLALVRARQHQAVAILGSATPSIETFYSAEKGKHELLELRTRPAERPMPSIEVVDLKDELKAQRAISRNAKLVFGSTLLQGLEQTLSKGEQALVFVNRKGFASFLMCRDCADVPHCLNCSVSLTYYQRAHEVRCHYCGFAAKAPDQCPKCKSFDLKCMGLGTELVEDEVRRLFPSVVVDRLDADNARTPKKLEETLERFRKGHSQVLVGTQMLAKGHDFPNVTFVGVVAADLSLHLPDFRAGERTFQLLAQVAGRAGRGDKPGKVVIQTFLPEHFVIQSAMQQDYRLFYRQELECRREFGYPPFSRMALLEFRHPKEDNAIAQAEHVQRLLAKLGAAKSPGAAQTFEFLGPAAAGTARIANQFRWQILLKSEKSSALNAVIKTLRKEGVRFIDVDPVSTL